jgi:hypothetical protein
MVGLRLFLDGFVQGHLFWFYLSDGVYGRFDLAALRGHTLNVCLFCYCSDEEGVMWVVDVHCSGTGSH